LPAPLGASVSLSSPSPRPPSLSFWARERGWSVHTTRGYEGKRGSGDGWMDPADDEGGGQKDPLPRRLLPEACVGGRGWREILRDIIHCRSKSRPICPLRTIHEEETTFALMGRMGNAEDPHSFHLHPARDESLSTSLGVFSASIMSTAVPPLAPPPLLPPSPLTQTTAGQNGGMGSSLAPVKLEGGGTIERATLAGGLCVPVSAGLSGAYYEDGSSIGYIGHQSSPSPHSANEGLLTAATPYSK